MSYEACNVPQHRLHRGIEAGLDEDIPRHDIGGGTPVEILRESELTQELLLLYFDNFSDIHFMFDQETFLRELALGETSKLIIYSILALSIRYVLQWHRLQCSYCIHPNALSSSLINCHSSMCFTQHVISYIWGREKGLDSPW